MKRPTSHVAASGSGLLLCILMFLLSGSCQTPVELLPEDSTTSDPLLAQIRLVDIALLKPDVAGSGNRFLAENIRDACRKTLIDHKLYAVPSNLFVDETLSGRDLKPGETPGVLGSDAVLLVTLTRWNRDQLVTRGLVYASGQVQLLGAGRVLWERRFKNKKLLAAGPVRVSNRAALEGKLIQGMMTDLLSTLPRKKPR